MKKYTLHMVLLAVMLLLAACGPKTPAPDPEAQIRQAVAATLNAMPEVTPPPTSIPRPTPTVFSLTGLFCEYEFCIGHPPELAFYDVVAKQNPASPAASTYENGILAAHNSGLFIQLIWQHAPGATDPQFLMELILEQGLDARAGNFELRLIHDMNVLSSPITTTVSPLLPFGGVAGWICGERAFAWKVYTQQAESFQSLLNEALDRFTCEN